MSRGPLVVFLTAVAGGCAPQSTEDAARVTAVNKNSEAEGFINRAHKSRDGSKSRYIVFVPHDYDGTKPYPVIVFLHGLGQSGNDGLLPVKYGLAAAIRNHQKTFPFITIFPQSQDRTWLADSQDGRRVLAILDAVRQDFEVDADRVYLTGYSMGGEGTFSLAAAHPDRWAAIVPICGSADSRLAAKLKDMPCWCFVGDADAPSTLYGVRRMMRDIKKAGGNPIYHEYPGIGHDCWDHVYTNSEVYEWLLLQRRD